MTIGVAENDRSQISKTEDAIPVRIARDPLRWGKRSEVLRWGKREPLRWGKRSSEEEEPTAPSDNDIDLVRVARESPLRWGKRSVPAYTRETREASPLRWGKRAPLRWGKRNFDEDKRAPLRWGKRDFDEDKRAPLRWGKRAPSRFGKRAPNRFGKRDSVEPLEEESDLEDVYVYLN